jgi:hypothetical protein
MMKGQIRGILPGLNDDYWAQLADLTREVGASRARRDRASKHARKVPFVNWVTAGNFVADREPLDLDRQWRYLRPIYAAVPEDLRAFDLVIQKSAQGGATIFSMLWTLWLALRGRFQIGYYLPTKELATDLSANRFIRLVRDNPRVHALMGDPETPHQRISVDEGSASVRRIGYSIVYYSYLEGIVTTESKPLDALVFDEVHQMSTRTIEQTQERVSASELKATVRVSTANFPGADINFYYAQSDQREFHTRCSCPDGVVLSDQWDPRLGPLCIGEGNGSTPGVPRGAFYFCPACQTVIADPQEGQFQPKNPGARTVGFHFPQMLSPKVTAAEMLGAWDRRVDTKNFYNRKLGRPYTDPDTQPVAITHLQAAQNPDLRWGIPPRQTMPTKFMGIDQMGQTHYVVIVGRDGDRMRVLHLEVIQASDPWRRAGQLLKEYNVRVCALEQLPNFDNAHRFAKDHDGRVFLVRYADLADEMVLWGDRPRDKMTVRRTEDEARTRWTATVDQYRMMAWALGKWVNAEVQTPDARTLMQNMRTDRGIKSVQICQDVLWPHLQHVALVTEPLQGCEQEHRFRRRVVKVGMDPHFAYAWMLCMVAWIRVGTTVELLAVEDAMRTLTHRTPQPSSDLDQVKAAFPQYFMELNSELRCGNCANFDPEGGTGAGPGFGYCRLRNFFVQPTDLRCDFHIPISEDE